METRTCQNCKKDFVIDQDDFSFYEKMHVPAPTFCPDCRRMRRMALMNIYSLYKRNCDKCGVSTISMHRPEKKQLVYCSKCWWADDWDGTEFGADYDPSRPFIEQLKELRDCSPAMAVDTLYTSLVNTSYTNYSSHLKDSYAMFYADYAENCFYSDFVNSMRDCADCYRVHEIELCYGCVGMNKSSRCAFSEECDSCVNVLFSKNCYGCSDCFGCMNLRNKSYCIFNEQKTKEEYQAFIAGLNLASHVECQKYLEKARTFWLTQPVRAYYGNALNVNVTGDYVYESKNTTDAYMVTSAEDSRYVEMLSVGPTKDAYDYTCWGGGAQRIYDSAIAGHESANILFSMGSYPNALNNEYCYYSSSCQNVFGCAHLKRKSYCILNKEYSKEEYAALRERIMREMTEHPYVDAQGRSYPYGELFPFDFSSFAYNETIAQQFMPKTKEQALAEGFVWMDAEPNQYTPTMQATDMPDVFDGDITKEIIQCSCGKCYRIVQGELDIIKKLGVPLPRLCPDCRRKERFSRVNPPKLYDRTCAQCGAKIRTSYAPERPEIVYCESCYQNEII